MIAYPRIFISAGEHSGDGFGAALARALLERAPEARLVGVGGPRMAAAGVRLLADTTGHAGMGLRYTFGNAGRWVRVFRHSIRQFNREPPDVFVPIDNPGFNLRLAGHARFRRIPVCYYVSPQVWAWLPHRIHRIGRLVDRMMAILPFEKALYDRIGVDCRFVGHPVLDYMPAKAPGEAARAAWLRRVNPDGRPLVGLLPGSRAQEIRHTFPIICDAALLLRARVPGVRFLVAATIAEHVPDLQALLAARGLDATILVGETPAVMQNVRLCLIVSGTATLETAWFRTPMVVFYRTSALFKHVAPRMLHVRHISLVNILAGREAVPEFLQFNDDPRPAAEAAIRLLTDPDAWERCRRDLDEVIASLGPPGATARAAEAVLDCIDRRSGLRAARARR